MTLYTIKWTETHYHEIDFDAAGETEALEEFWLYWNDASAETTVDTSGPQDIEVVWFKGFVLNSPQQKQEKA